jgi:hypothetical protein
VLCRAWLFRLCHLVKDFAESDVADCGLHVSMMHCIFCCPSLIWCGGNIHVWLSMGRSCVRLHLVIRFVPWTRCLAGKKLVDWSV